MTSSRSGGVNQRIAGSIFALTMVCVAGCGQATSEASADKTATAGSAASVASKQAEDRGNARFTTDGTVWNGTYASARLKDARLKISASKTERAGDKMKRDSLEFRISDYHGPGKYKADMMSMFVRVSIDMPKNNDAQVDAQKTLMDALGNTSNIRLANADIEISSDNGGYIDGTFSIDKPAGTPQSTISDGQFHARIRE